MHTDEGKSQERSGVEGRPARRPSAARHTRGAGAGLRVQTWLLRLTLRRSNASLLLASCARGEYEPVCDVVRLTCDGVPCESIERSESALSVAEPRPRKPFLIGVSPRRAAAWSCGSGIFSSKYLRRKEDDEAASVRPPHSLVSW